MTSDEVRKKYIEFFKSSPRNHKEIAPSPLILKDDPTTLFTSAGMQQLVPYLSGERKHPKGKRLVNSQPSFRANDLEEVGDSSHTTFFEMLGNWSLGDYFKKEEIPWLWEFLTKELGLPEKKLHITVFEGGKEVPKDKEAAKIWKNLGISEEKIFYYGESDNWWSRAGGPDEMPAGEIGGPSTEVFYEFTSVKHDPEYGKVCHPNCQCGRFLEIANSVFIQYRKKADGGLEELPQKNVDFGGGLERLIAAVNDEPDIFRSDLLSQIVEEIEIDTKKKYEGINMRPMRVIADHIRAAVFIIKAGVLPSNKEHGYVLRRLLRRASVKMHELGGGLNPQNMFTTADRGVLRIYDGLYFDRQTDRQLINEVLENETEKFVKTLDKGLGLVGKISAFDLFQSYGFPPELTEELLHKEGKNLNWEEFEEEIEKHKELSRQGATQKFGKDNK